MDYFNKKELGRYNMRIYKALLKYKHSNFSLAILEYCPVSKLLLREKYYIDFLEPEYNTCKEPGNTTLGNRFNLSSETAASPTDFL